MKFERMETGRDTRCKSKKKAWGERRWWRRWTMLTERRGRNPKNNNNTVCMIVLEWEKAYNMIFSYVLLRLVIIIIFTHMLHFSASNKTVVNMEQKRYHDSTLIRINVHCWNNFFLQYLPVTSHIALRKRTKKMVRRLKYRQLVSLMVLWLTLVWLRWFSCFNCSARLRPVYEKK